jgi:hypothetical protein
MAAGGTLTFEPEPEEDALLPSRPAVPGRRHTAAEEPDTTATEE